MSSVLPRSSSDKRLVSWVHARLRDTADSGTVNSSSSSLCFDCQVFLAVEVQPRQCVPGAGTSTTSFCQQAVVSIADLWTLLPLRPISHGGGSAWSLIFHCSASREGVAAEALGERTMMARRISQLGLFLKSLLLFTAILGLYFCFVSP